MQRASTLENSSFNVAQLKYLWRTTAVLGHSNSICLTVKWHLQWSQTGWLSQQKIRVSHSTVTDSYMSEDCFITTA